MADDLVSLLHTLSRSGNGSDDLDYEVCTALGFKQTVPITSFFEVGVGKTPWQYWIKMLRRGDTFTVQIGDDDGMFASAPGNTAALALAACMIACRIRRMAVPAIAEQNAA